MIQLLGWCGAYTSPYKEETFTEEHRKALVHCIKKRHYNFNYSDLSFLPYAAPFFDTGKIAIPSKAQFDSIMNEVYSNMPRSHRLMPQDAIKTVPYEDILFENDKCKEIFIKNRGE